MPCGYYAEQAAAETMQHRERLARARRERVFAVDAAAYFSRPGPRLVDGVELLGHLLHPELRAGAAARARSIEIDLERAAPRWPECATMIEPTTAAAPSPAHSTRHELRGSRSALAAVEQHERGERAADQPADVAADRDAADREGEHAG